jgi:hypothetical protein
MIKTIEIKLSEAQHAALAAAAKAAGKKFYDHCRDQLLARVTTAPEREMATKSRGEFDHLNARGEEVYVGIADVKPDRMDRLEEMVARLATAVDALAGVPREEPQEEIDIDIDDVVGRSLSEAESQGLTAIPEQVEAPSGNGVRHVGTRPRMPYTGPAPAHLRGIG